MIECVIESPLSGILQMFKRIFNKTKTNNGNSASDKSVATEENSNSFTQLTAEKIKSVIISLNQAEPIFKDAGFVMQQLDVEFGNTPKLTPSFKQLEVISEDKQDEFLAELVDQQLIKFILISLFKSSRMKSLFEGSELYFYGMEIDISAEPSVRTIFRRKDAVAEVVPIK